MEKIRTLVHDDHEALAREVAAAIAATIRARNAEGRAAVLGLATGSTPVGVGLTGSARRRSMSPWLG